MRTAFKEWSRVVAALGKGEQILILRKGGLDEGRNGFQAAHPRFWLFPTRYHQQRERLLPSLSGAVDPEPEPGPSRNAFRLEYWAEVVDSRHLTRLEDVELLKGQHGWTDEVVRDRFGYGTSPGLNVMAVRVRRIPMPVERPLLPEYAGCRSWIELGDPPGLEGSQPVLEDSAFAALMARYRAAVDSPAAATMAFADASGVPLVPAKPVILASASPRRRDLLRSVVRDFYVVSSHASELEDAGLGPRRLCEMNAERKAMLVAERYPDHWVLGADTLVFLDGRPLGKPEGTEAARSMLRSLSGRVHEVVTGVCLVDARGGRLQLFSEITRVRFRQLTAAAIDDYLGRVDVMDKAGAYAIQEEGDRLVESVEGSPSNVVGLPVAAVRAALERWQ